MSETSPAELLEEMTALRRRARADRHGFWFPLVLFGVLMLAAAPLYIAHEVPAESVAAGGDVADSRNLYAFQLNLVRAGRYWLAALIIGGLLTVWWYRRRGRRIGPQSAGAVAVVTAALAVAAAAIVGITGLRWIIVWPFDRGYSVTLVIAVGLIGLALVERSAGLTVITVLYTGAAVLANTYNVENVLFDLGWDPFIAHPDQARFTPLPNLLLPALVLLLAGAATGLPTLARRLRQR
ncbi:MAG: hypothetical protein V7637_1910 [Mycobacteriales bacterium]|jgi:hypothetical protein